MLEKILNSAALILGVANGLFLLYFYLRDKPKLKVVAVHMEANQFWFKLSDGVYNNQPTRRYGFFAYIGISNRGLRDVSLTSWHLRIKTRNFTKYDLMPQSIPEPTFKLGNSENNKILPVLGIRGVFHDGETNIKSGSSIGGTAFYILESRGSDAWDPLIEDDKIRATMIVTDVFGKTNSCEIFFRKRTTEDIEKLLPDLLKVQ